MPPKHRKKASASAAVSIQGRASQRKNTAEVIADSGDEFEHITVEAEDRYVRSYYLSCLFLQYLNVFIFKTALMNRMLLRSVTMKRNVKTTMN
jgi:hypothetical protein